MSQYSKYSPVGGGGGSGTVTDVTATAPLQSSGGTTPDLSIPEATSLVDGYLSAADWSAFNSKQAALTPGSISTSTTGVTVGGGASSTVGPNVTVDVQTASGSQPGLLSAADWTTFNNKISASNITAKVIFVSQDTGNDANAGSYLAPLKTIQAGINKAELIAAYYNQVIVNVTPSSSGTGYNENLTFSQQGVTLQAYAPDHRSDSVVIKGNITVNLTGTSGGGNFVAASNIVYIKGCVLTAASGNTLTFSGTTFQRLFLDQVYMDNTGTGSTIVCTNTGTSGGTKSTITALIADINNNSASNPTLKLSAGRFFLDGSGSTIQNANATGQSVLIDGASATAATMTAALTTIAGQVNVSDNLSNLSLSLCTISSGSAAALVTPATPSTGLITLANVGFTTTATNTITGAGVVALLGNNVKLSTGGDVISTVTQATINSFPQGAIMLGATATQVTNALLTIKNGHIKSQQTTAPTVAAANSGTSPTVTLSNATDTAGKINYTTGSGSPTSGATITVTFNKAHATAPIVIITPTNANAATFSLTSPMFYVSSSTTTTFVISVVNAPAASTAYTFNYQAIETQ